VKGGSRTFPLELSTWFEVSFALAVVDR